MENNNKIYKDIGKRLAKYRKDNNFSQKQLAEKLGISQQLLANFELGQRRIHVTLLLRIASCLYITVDDLLGITNKNKPGPNPKIKKKIEEIQNLPIEKQKRILESLDDMIKGAKQKAS